MAPEIFKKQGHGKPVDMWALGVISYFLLCGYTPFDKENQVAEISAICSADYAFEPAEYWVGVSETGESRCPLYRTLPATSRSLTRASPLA